jgi:hypothetical protein
VIEREDGTTSGFRLNLADELFVSSCVLPGLLGFL